MTVSFDARYQPGRLSLSPSLPPLGVTALTLRGLAFHGGTIRVTVTADRLTVSRTSGPVLAVTEVATGKTVTMATHPDTTDLPAGPVTIHDPA